MTGPVEAKMDNGTLQLKYCVMFTGTIHTDGCTDEYFGGIFNVGDTISLDLSNISTFIRSLYGNSVCMLRDYDMFRYSYEQCFESEYSEHDYEESVKELACMTDWFDSAVELPVGKSCTVEIRYCIVKGFFFFTSPSWLDNSMSVQCSYLQNDNLYGQGEICVPLAPVSFFKCEYGPFVDSDRHSNRIRDVHRKPEMLKAYEMSHPETSHRVTEDSQRKDSARQKKLKDQKDSR